MSPPSTPPILTLGKYHLIANLGHGGMADVFLAVVRGPVGFQKLQVIKRPRPNVAEEPDLLAMFLDEARLAARLSHPNVVLTNEVAEVDGLYFIAMEYLEGQPLNRILYVLQKREDPGGPASDAPSTARPPGTRELLLRVVADALAGLHHAHELADYDGTPLCVVHRDASPHNIFVTYDGQTKVVDFGIAKAATRSIETQDGILRGKIAYMSPEQARGLPVDRRADIFAMGLVMWEVLTGARARKGTEHEILDSLRSGEVPPVSSVWAACPAELEAIVARATTFAQEERYATALEMRQDILAHLDATGARAAQEEVGKLVTRLFDRKRAEMKGIIERQLASLRAARESEVRLPALDPRRLGATDAIELPRAPLMSLPPPAPRGDSERPSAGPRATGRSAAEGAHPGREGTASAPRSGGADASETGPSETVRSPGAKRPASRAPLWIGATAVTAAVTVLALSSRDRPGAPTPASAAAVGEAASAAAGSTADAAQSATASGDGARAADTIEIRVSAQPAGARMFLDDTALVSNPFVGRFRRDDRPHTVRVEADGHRTVTRAISFASDQTLEVTLDRAEALHGKLPDAPGERSTSASPSAASAADPSAGATADPGAPDDDELPPPGTPPRKELDSDDPWK